MKVGVKKNHPESVQKNQEITSAFLQPHVLICKNNPKRVIESLALGPDGHLIHCSDLFPVIQKRWRAQELCWLSFVELTLLIRLSDLLLVLVAFVGGGEQGGGVMTFTVFAGKCCYGSKWQLSLPYFFHQFPLDNILIIKVVTSRQLDCFCRHCDTPRPPSSSSISLSGSSFTSS